MIGSLSVAAEASQRELLGSVNHVVHRLELEHLVVLKVIIKNASQKSLLPSESFIFNSFCPNRYIVNSRFS